MKKIVVIGCGKVSLKHFKAISYLERRKKIKLVAICDSDIKKMNSLNLSKSVKKYNSISKLIKNGIESVFLLEVVLNILILRQKRNILLEGILSIPLQLANLFSGLDLIIE